MKTCKKCKIKKEICNFRFRKDRGIYYSQCKECEKKYKQINYLKNIEENKKNRKRYYQENKEEIISKVINYQKNNGTWMKKYNSDPIFKMNHNVRCRIREFLSQKNLIKKNKTSDIVGCNQTELKFFLETKFKFGMTWDNYGEWHIDHIVPLSSATNEIEIINLCHFTNLQPLWKSENLKKGNKIQ
jgi:hypothetical protein